ncbi:MAG: class I SAM-dependent methyltransferase [Planctomycetota bacterium]|jgi:extracellular factor (EF) 3-hydroxypalmitic acid methyl ester biosynthesis protein|nr:class I SAM-dependent methyltransferase [Planctomycetota bacterium]
MVTDNGFLSFRNSQQTEVRGTLMHLTRNQVVFEVYNPYSIVQLSEVLSDLRIRRGERTLYHGRAVVSNLVNTGLMLITSATLVDPWSDLAEFETSTDLSSDITAFVDDWNTANSQLLPPFQLAVSKLRNFLEELSRWVDQGETAGGLREDQADDERQRAFVDTIEHGCIEQLSQLYGAFEAEARQVPSEIATAHRAFAQRELHPLTLCAPFVHRTFSKPLGYAGDYEMVNMILRDPTEGSSSYARLINRLYLKLGPAEAHRNRIARLQEILRTEARRVQSAGQTFRALNIGCGPAHELQGLAATESWLADADIELLDFNQETLEHARVGIAAAAATKGFTPGTRFTHKSIHELLKDASPRRGSVTPERRYDLVYCAGLFDYLSDKVCQRLLKLFVAMTKAGGLVVTTNVHPANPIRCNMEYLLEWHLIYRDESAMQTIAPPGHANTVYPEDTGLNVFLETRLADLLE